MDQAIRLLAMVAALSVPSFGLADGSSDRKSLFELKRDIAWFAADAQAPLAPGSDSQEIVGRLATGFQQDPARRLATPAAGQIYWGWQEGQAFVRSVALYDQTGELRLAAAVDDLPQLYSRHPNRTITTSEEYLALLVKQAGWGSHPSVVLFARGAEDLTTHLPLFRRWLQAAMLGFSVDCSDASAAAACGFAEQVDVPTAAFDIDCLQQDRPERCHIAVPDAPAAAVPLEQFVQ